jgi:hypothetical protein
MVDRKRPARRRGWAIALSALLAIAGIVTGILAVNGTLLPQTSPPYPQIVGTNCGTITDGEHGAAGDFPASEQCLWHAYETCQAATLVYKNWGLDFIGTHAVTVYQHDKNCLVTDATQGVLEGHGELARDSYQCTGMEQQASGLVLLGCGAEGDITIPASPRQ